jgi:hypothetical protein
MNKKYLHSIFFLICFGHSFAQDSVDQLAVKYTYQAKEGLIRLHNRHREELVKILNTAMELKDLTLANKANDKIKQLDDEIRMLGGAPTEPKPSVAPMPSNLFYRMISHTGGIGTEYGHEILCRFKRLSTQTTAGSLTLTLTSNPAKFCDTPNDIFILDGLKGKVIGTQKGIGIGQKVKISLTLVAANELDIVVVVRGSDALHLKPFDGSEVPELYLTVE